MFALRRAANPFSDASGSEQHGTTSSCPNQVVSGNYVLASKNFLQSQSYHQNYFTTRGLCSQVGAKSSGEDENLEDGFTELDSISEYFVEDQNEIDLADIETDTVADEDSKKRKAAPFQQVSTALDKFVTEENSISRHVISLVILNLRKCRMFGKALQVCVKERDYASRLDLISKIRGLVVVEHYIESIPKSVRGEIIFRTLLANCVSDEKLNKAKAPFACNQLILLYKKLNKKKIADVLLLMEKDDVKSIRYTYKLKTWKKPPAKSKDLAKRTTSDGYRIDPLARDSLVKLFVEAGEVEKADSVLQKAIQQDHQVRPMFNSFMVIKEQYSRRGKILHQLRQPDYVRKTLQYLITLFRVSKCNQYRNYSIFEMGSNHRDCWCSKELFGKTIM
ncbi:hypothetical protein MKW98_013792 [Papaver atlanticum]|uniref:Pentatricopeptide repeat-containing protein n=1 Tax=Papaver atlanticum TaxID=357466 RepID=A0AAD4TAE8_9MAGN|nr:hypothetical protein MKW98_013792 [Papaver atlanticum]